VNLVIDSNIWISAIVFGGSPRTLLVRVILDGHIIVQSDPLIAETERILIRKFPLFVEDFHSLLSAMDNRVNIVQIGANPVSVCRDPNDNFIIETALIGNAEFVITGDNDLLTLQQYNTVSFVTVRQWLDRFTHF